MRVILKIIVLLALGPAAAPAQDEGGDRLWLQGKLLVASEDMDDPNFRRTVIYMVRHGPDGAFGLIVNRRIASGPLGRLMESLGREDPETGEQTIEVYDGGPVAREHAMVLHGEDYIARGTVDAGSGLRLTPLEAALDDIAREEGPASGLLIVGHAGWAPGQLEQEIGQGAWSVAEAGPAFVLDPEVEGKWRRALMRVGEDL